MPESKRTVSFWIGTVVVSLIGTFLFCRCGGALLEPIFTTPPLVERLLFQPGLYGGHLWLNAHCFDHAANSNYSLYLQSKSPGRWAWSRPGVMSYRQTTLSWRSANFRTPFKRSEGEAVLDLASWQIRHQGVILPLTEEDLASLTGIDITRAESRNELTAFLDYLKQARGGTLQTTGHHGYSKEHGLLHIRMHNSVPGFPPFPFLIVFAFCLGLILVWAKCPGPWQEKRRH